MQLKPLFLAAAAVAMIVAIPAFLSSRVSAGDLNKQIPAPLADPASRAG